MLDQTPDTSTVLPEKYDGPILEIENLSISFFTRLREIPAVMDFSTTVMPGEAMGLVGESGCGKSTVALGVMQDLGVNGRIVGGSIKFKGRNLNDMTDDELRTIRGKEIAMIYQEPMASLNPAMRIGKQLMEVLTVHEGIGEDEAYQLRRFPRKPTALEAFEELFGISAESAEAAARLNALMELPEVRAALDARQSASGERIRMSTSERAPS